ncbi:hypothetical protein V8C35DRAFT_317051 [Trichoderma chlorosporum]
MATEATISLPALHDRVPSTSNEPSSSQDSLQPNTLSPFRQQPERLDTSGTSCHHHKTLCKILRQQVKTLLPPNQSFLSLLFTTESHPSSNHRFLLPLSLHGTVSPRHCLFTTLSLHDTVSPRHCLFTTESIQAPTTGSYLPPLSLHITVSPRHCFAAAIVMLKGASGSSGVCLTATRMSQTELCHLHRSSFLRTTTRGVLSPPTSEAASACGKQSSQSSSFSGCRHG